MGQTALQGDNDGLTEEGQTGIDTKRQLNRVSAKAFSGAASEFLTRNIYLRLSNRLKGILERLFSD